MEKQGRLGARGTQARRNRRAAADTAQLDQLDSMSEENPEHTDPARDVSGKAPQGRPAPRGDTAEPAVRPVAARARLKRRHSGLFLAFVIMVIVPTFLFSLYLNVFAQDMYASKTEFTVRSEETTSASELVGGLSAFVGGSTTSNANVLYAYVHSQQIVERTQEQVDLRAHYSEFWRTDPLFSIWPDATIEDLMWYWHRIVTVSYDQNSGLMDVQVNAHTAEMAQRIAQVIVSESEEMINALNEQARSDTMANAQRDLDDALERLRTAREELASFRARTQIVDPQADIAGRMGVINGLQQTLAQALVDYDLLLQTSAESDPRVRQAERRIEVIRQRITEERRNFATQDVTTFDTDYPRLIAQFEALTVNQEFAEMTYTAALQALDSARSNAQRQSLYLATYVRPTLAERAEYPQRMQLTLLLFGFLLLGWAALAMIYYSLRDRG
ncbi:sugar transporter [Pararhodobacter sp. CCB-MM2]|uniref:sugar transporter n=1 Tax=Pararhodobacter sp. CCB-MM2 TaxID=1786003 RepID=UPI001111CFA2|nr:sugar transporter [Pararhodobacter sp. CCB-MM2]